MPVRLRDLCPGEQEPVRAVFDGLSPRSRNRRFHGPVERLSPAMLDVLSAADGYDHVVIVAETGLWRRRRTLGLARLVRTGPVTAELAVEVIDEAQGQGRPLVSAAKARAVVLGLQWIEADVHDANAPMLHLLCDVFSGIEASRIGDVWELRCPVVESRARRRPAAAPGDGMSSVAGTVHDGGIGRALVVLVEQMAAEHEDVHVGGHEAAVGVLGAVDNGFSANIEARVEQCGAAGAGVKLFEEPPVAAVSVAIDSLQACSVVHVGDGG